MRQRRFGRLDFKVGELALGTWGLSGDGYGQVYEGGVDRVIDEAQEKGVDLFETADVYGEGAMETKLGERLDPEKTRVVTKIGTFRDSEPPRKRFDPTSLREAFDRQALRAGEAVDFMRQLVKDEELAAWGVSAGSGEVAAAAVDRGAHVVELVYNLFMQRDLHSLSEEVEGKDVAILARSVLAHGLLCGTWPYSKTFASYDHRSRRWSPDELRYRIGQLDAVRPLVRGEVFSLRAAAVVGPRSIIQFDQLMREVGDGPPYLPDPAMAELPQRLEAVGIEV
jgi:aryl-alcohol dehydrogenase-like predicted oxidoreductase